METTTLALLRQSVAMAFFCLTGFSCFGASEAEEKLHFSQFVRPYEPIKIGFTKDEGDQLYMDFSLSVMLPAAALIPHPKIKPENYFPREGNVRSLTGERFPNWYIAFNGRAGQYVGTRKSSPVVGKRFNPLLAARWWRGGSVDFGLHDYFEVSYGHESKWAAAWGFEFVG